MPSRLVLYIIAYLATVTAGVAASIFSAYLPAIVTDLTGASDRETIAMVGSNAGAAFLFGWAVGAIFLGALGDRAGRKTALFISVMVTTLGIVATAFVPTVIALILIRFITGAGAGSVLLLSAVMVSEAWSTAGRARMVGILANAFPVGLIVAGVIGGFIDDWRTAYLVGGSTVILGLGIILYVPESEWWKTSAMQHRERQMARERVLDALYRRDLISGIVLFGSMLVGLWAVFVWMPTWVGTIGTAEQAQNNRSWTTLALGIGSVAGGFLSGPLADRFGRRPAAAIGYVGCAVVTILTFLPDAGINYLFGAAFTLSLFIGLNQGVLVNYIPELFPTLIRGVATAISFNIGRLATTAGVVTAGYLITWLGGYDNAILTFGLAYVVGLVMLLRARETQGSDLPA
jgi:MFS family permease